MLFSHRIAALIAVVAIPLGIAVTSYALTDSSDTPKVPPKVKLESNSPGGPTGTAGSPGPTQGDETVAPPVSENPGDDDTPQTTPSTSPVTGRPGTNGGAPGTGPTGGGTGGGATKPAPGNNGGDDDGPGGDDFGDDG
ncbi:hypothetical protein [Streptomyces qinzhouensis]|uniref:Small secreted hydrophilic protein n=1 Tax=Streptomyces qinzhouensis TaxID=2599401 RepID=A0A5B8J3Q0_9ACTN|nr:hypothetical protein [Streptomyces qinzhouensis]QDY76375.1 hypothetical protein FQU76_07305 [Streptomyces qinzhouensis]